MNQQFKQECEERIKSFQDNEDLINSGIQFMKESVTPKYSYNFSWLGRPIIQYPQDIIAMQEIIWNVKPDLIIETGIAHGGSLIFYASMLKLLEVMGYIKEGKVLGVDVDIRNHNRVEIEKHPLASNISMIEGSSIEDTTIKEIYDKCLCPTRFFGKLLCCI
jgi:cephalosporin hydroxylase